MMAGKKEIKLVPTGEQPYEIPENWCWTTIGTLADVKGGKRLPKGKALIDSRTDHPYIRVTDFKEQSINLPKVKFIDEETFSEIKNYTISNRDIYVSIAGSIGKVGIIPDELDGANLTENAAKITSIRCVNQKYLLHALMTEMAQEQMSNATVSTTQAKLALCRIETVCIPLAPAAEQERIVTAITELFADLEKAAENAQKIIDSYDGRVSSILHQAFTGQLIGMDAYSTIPLESIADTIRIGPFGSALHKEDYICGGIPVINPKHIKNQEIMPEDKVTVSAEKATELSSYRLKANDIVIARRGDMGRSAPVSTNEEGWLCGTGSMIIRLKNGYDGAFYSQIIASKACVDYLEENCVGSTLKNLNEKIIRQLPIPNLTQEQQQEIVRILDELLGNEQRIKEAAEEMLDKIAMMKKSILADAFRGKLGTNDPADEPATELLRQILA